MRRKHLYLVWPSLLLVAAAVGQGAELAHRWSFNGDLVDSIGGRDATIVNLGGNATLSETQVTLAGGARGSSDYIALPSGIVSSLGDTVTVQIWATQQSVQNWSRIFDFGTSTAHNVFMSWTNGTALNTDRFEWVGLQQNSTVDSSNAPYTLGVEFHIVVVFEPGRVTWYTAPANSDQLGQAKGTFQTPNRISNLNDTNVWFGRSHYGDNTANASYNEVRLWVGALTEQEREFYHAIGPDIINPNIARSPSPENLSDDLMRTIGLSWTPGDAAVRHDVYLGTALEDVENASRADPRDVLVSQGQTDAGYTPPVRFDLGQTYYWRIDEVDATGGIEKGLIWEFTIEPRAYPLTDVDVAASVPPSPGSDIENIVDGNVRTMWLGQAEPGDIVTVDFAFDRVYKLDEMLVWNHNHALEQLLNFSVKDVTIKHSTDGDEWTVLGDYVLPRGTGEVTFPAKPIDFGGVPAKYVRFTITSNYGGKAFGLSEVQFYWIPVFAREPEPEAGATVADPDVVLSWRPGREAVSHEVYLGTDSNAVAAGEALVATVAAPSYDTHPLNLLLDERYYWMINEVNEAEETSVWSSDVWNFNMPGFVVVDNFEGYDGEENLIYEAWADGYGVAANGSVVGHDGRPYVETATTRSGSQSMPFFYKNTGTATLSEAKRTFAPQDWTRSGIESLIVHFYGAPTNGAGQLYLMINNTRINYPGPAGDLARRRWTQWTIDLSTVPASVLRNVNSMTIGVGNAGVSGLLFIDDLLLYRTAPEVPAPVDPGVEGLVAYYPFNNNVQDASGSGNHGTIVGAPTYATGPTGYGQALRLNGTSDAVNLGNKAVWNPTGSFSVSVWANIEVWSTNWEHVLVGNHGISADPGGWSVRRAGSNSVNFSTRALTNVNQNSTTPMPLNEWIHITCVRDADRGIKQIYVNGMLDAQTNATGDLGSTNVNTYIGATADPGNVPIRHFTGRLDEVRIYHRALSPGEVEFLAKPTP